MKTVLSICEDKFLINNKLTYSEIENCPQKLQGLLMNARFIQGIIDEKDTPNIFDRFGRTFDSEKNTDDLISALPEWYSYGLRAFTVGLQGGGPCFTIKNNDINANPYSCDGKKVDVKTLNRLERLINAADKLGMIVIVSYFYSDQTRFLNNDDAAISAVKTMSNWLRDKKFTNIIIEVSNEWDVGGGFKTHPILSTEDGIVRLMKIARCESGGMPVGCSSMGKFFEKIAKESDVIIIHGNGQSRQKYYNSLHLAKNILPIRPVLCNEDSQAFTRSIISMEQGVSWGYYNNMTKQEPPTIWNVTKGEDKFYALRIAMELGLKPEIPKFKDQFVLQGINKDERIGDKCWIRLASLYPEKIDHVDFYQNKKLFYTNYEEPFNVNYDSTWRQGPVTDVTDDDIFEAVVTLTDGTKFTVTK